MFKVKKIILILITGLIWTTVGIMLIKRAFTWFPNFTLLESVFTVFAGIILAYIKTRFIFIKATNKNIHRIMNLSGNKVFVFAFHSFKFYILILIMIGFGTLLRSLEFIPKYAIFPIYLGVGLAMIYGSYIYYLYFSKNKQS